ncbi:MAG TPA: hypothetical protein VGM56_32680 [Byssovorax sp.]|jgi:hypothetical protein
MKTHLIALVAFVAAGCEGSKPSVQPQASEASTTATLAGTATSSPTERLSFTATPLPPATGDTSLDFIAYEPGAERIWIPNARDAGYVDVYDIAKRAFTHVTGFGTKTAERKGKTRTQGPSSAAVGDGVIYVGDRGTSEICPVDAKTLKVGTCLHLDAQPDCLTYVPSTKELWVTTPSTKAVEILDAAKPDALKRAASVAVDGEPEGFALDDARGLFYTNLEDKDRTLRIDVKTRAVTATWSPACGEKGPRGLRVDGARGLVLVACTDHVQILDAAHDGAARGKLETGDGVDDVEYVAGRKLLYVAASKAHRLTIARIGDDGSAAVVATGETVDRARNAVVDASGEAFLVDPSGPRLLTFAPPK